MTLRDFRPSWLSTYSPVSFSQDVLAGLILSVLLAPQAMAYAQLAGLPPVVGLYAAIAPPLIYMLLGASPFVSLGPVALVSLLIAEATGSSGPGAGQAAVVIAIEAGVMLALLGTFRLGRLVNFVSEPALLGFTAAAAFLIAASQLPPLLGIEIERSGNILSLGQTLLPVLGETHLATLAIGLAALTMLLIADRYFAAGLWRIGVHLPWRTAIAKSVPLLVLTGAALIVAIDAPGVRTVEAAGAGMPPLGIDPPPLDVWLRLLPSSLIVAVVAFVIGTAAIKSLAGDDRSAINSSREAFAIGVANIGAGLTGGYAVGVSLSRSALLSESGARSPVASVIAALMVLALTLFAAGALGYLPETALAALVIGAVFGLVRVREIVSVWRYSKVEGCVFLATFLVTLFLGVRWGLTVGALFGIAAFLWFSSVPRVTRVGSMDEGASFRSIDRDEVEVDTLPVLVVRIDRSIFFGNAAYCENRILEFVDNHADTQCLILDMRAVNTIDASGMAMLDRLIGNLEQRKLTVNFAAIHEPVYTALQATDRAGSQTFYRTVHEAIDECGGDLPA